MYQLLVPIGLFGIVFYFNRKYEKYVFNNSILHNGTFDDFHIVDVKDNS